MEQGLVEKERQNTPGISSDQQCDPVAHFNNAGCSLPSSQVVNALKAYLDLEAQIGGYEAVGKHWTDLKQRPYLALANLLNCDSEEIAILSSCTAAWQQIISGLAWTWKPGDRIITSVSEYGSNYIAYLQLAKRTGVLIEVVPETQEGDIDLAALEVAVTEKDRQRGPVVLISITHVPTSSGRVYDAAGVGAIAKKYGVLYMLDACQSVGQMVIDVQHIGCDFLAGTGRKYLRGPRGSGFLYCSKTAMSRFEPAALDNTGAYWSDATSYIMDPTAKRFEMYEMSMAARFGLAIAVEHLLELTVSAVWHRIQHLANTLRTELKKVPGVTVLDHGKVLCGIVSFTVAGWGCEDVQSKLLAQGINTSVSYIGSTRLDFEQRKLQQVVRASVHYYNNDEEIERLITALRKLKLTTKGSCRQM